MIETAAAPPVDGWLLGLLECPRCAGRFTAEQGLLRCASCEFGVPVRGRIPVFVHQAPDAIGRRTQSSFGYEWTHFSDWQPSGQTNFDDYFAEIDARTLAGATVLDAGCGMGRHARFVAAYAERVVALDFSDAIDVAARNLAALSNVACVRADLRAIPFADNCFDFIYSLGVVHHLPDPDAAIRALVAKLRRGGRLRIYVYWSPGGWKKVLLSAVAAVRRVTTRMPLTMLRALSWMVSVALFAAVVAPYRALSRLGIALGSRWPLVVYEKYPFRVLYNDQFDRFSAPVERRYSEHEARRLLESAGLDEVRVVERYGWIVDGRKP
jgi:SAM-dependent methyltransferase